MHLAGDLSPAQWLESDLNLINYHYVTWYNTDVDHSIQCFFYSSCKNKQLILQIFHRNDKINIKCRDSMLDKKHEKQRRLLITSVLQHESFHQHGYNAV